MNSFEGYGIEEFHQSQRLFALGFVKIFRQHGHHYTKNILKKTFEKSTVDLFPALLTEENLNSVIMNLKATEVKFK